jgi:hypothetical protein
MTEQLDAGLLILDGYDAAGEDMRSCLAQVGYDGAAFDAFRQVWGKAGGARSAALGERGDQHGATEALNVLHQKVAAQVSALSQTAKAVFESDVDARTTLGLELPKQPASQAQPAADGSVPEAPPKASRRDRSLAGLLDRGRILYGNALGHPELLAVLAGAGYGEVRLRQELEEVTALGRADAVQEREKGEATASTTDQKAALTEMQDWISRFRGIVTPALRDKPQYLTALGLKPRGGKR